MIDQGPHWTHAEEAVLAAATGHAVSARETQPWVLEFRDRDVLLIERVDLHLSRHDPAGRNRLISCGSALANLRLAVRRLGWTESWQRFPLPGRRDVVALVRAGERLAPTLDEIGRYAAIGACRSHGARFAGPPLASAHLPRATDVPGTAVVPLSGPRRDAALGHLVNSVTARGGGDRACRAELAPWTGARAAGQARDLLGRAGGVTLNRDELTARFAQEAQLVVITTGDGPSDHLHAGVALQQTWLALSVAGLAASAITRSPHLNDVCAGLVEAAGMPGFPQVILRVGIPAVELRPTFRRPIAALLRASGKVR